MKSFIFTSESVTKGHPDKVSDIISDSILDAYLEKDPTSRVAVETVVKNNTIILVGEISSAISIDSERVVRQAIRDIGYTREELGFNADTAELILRLDRQSPDIAQGWIGPWKSAIRKRRRSSALAIREWCSAMRWMRRRNGCPFPSPLPTAWQKD